MRSTSPSHSRIKQRVLIHLFWGRMGMIILLLRHRLLARLIFQLRVGVLLWGDRWWGLREWRVRGRKARRGWGMGEIRKGEGKGRECMSTCKRRTTNYLTAYIKHIINTDTSWTSSHLIHLLSSSISTSSLGPRQTQHTTALATRSRVHGVLVFWRLKWSWVCSIHHLLFISFFFFIVGL